MRVRPVLNAGSDGFGVGFAPIEGGESSVIDVELRQPESATVMQRTDGTDAVLEQRADWFFTARCWEGEPVPSYERVVLDGIARDTLSAFTSYGFGP